MTVLGAFVFSCTSTSQETLEEDVARLLAQGRQQLGAKDMRQAIVSMRMVLLRDSTNIDAIAGLAEIYRTQQRMHAADGYQRRVIFETYSKGMELLDAGDESAATATFERGVELHPTHTLALIELGKLASRASRSTEAIGYFERAREASPQFAAGRTVLGWAYLAVGRYADARVEFEHALRLNVNAVDAQLGLAQTLAGEERWLEAAHHFERTLTIDPNSEAAVRGLRETREHL